MTSIAALSGHWKFLLRQSLSAKVLLAVVPCIALAIVAASISVRAQTTVLTNNGDVSPQINNGQDIFLTAGGVGCAACHGAYGEGDVGIGPYIRGVNKTSIEAALESVSEMSFLETAISDRTVDDIAAYVEWLGNHQLVKTLAKRGRFIPDTAAVRPNTPVQLVVSNTSRFPRTFSSDDMGLGEITVEGREAAVIIWTAPPQEGTFTLRCLDCRITDQRLVIDVSNAAPEFLPATAPPVPVASAEPRQAHDMTLIERGHEIFLGASEVGCVACHGAYAEGDVGIGPYNRGFDEEAIRQALASVPAMQFLNAELTDEQVSQVAAYYSWLGDHQLFKVRMIRGEFFPNRIRVPAGTSIQLVVNNRGRSPGAFASINMDIEPFVVLGSESVDFFWDAPQDGGEFTLQCIDCSVHSGRLTIDVTAAEQP